MLFVSYKNCVKSIFYAVSTGTYILWAGHHKTILMKAAGLYRNISIFEFQVFWYLQYYSHQWNFKWQQIPDKCCKFSWFYSMYSFTLTIMAQSWTWIMSKISIANWNSDFTKILFRFRLVAWGLHHHDQMHT